MRHDSLSFSNRFIPGTLIIAALLSIVPYTMASAQTENLPPIIAPIQHIERSPDTLKGGVNGISGDFNNNILTLQQNLADLAALNTPENQAKLNALGQNYSSNVSSLGSDLGAVIASIDVSQITDDTSTMSRQITTQLNGFSNGMASMVKSHMSALDMADTTVNLTNFMSNVMLLNGSVNKLNGNVASLTQTYKNLLALSDHPPSELAMRNDLPNAIMGLDGMAIGDLKNLSGLGDSVVAAKDSLAGLSKTGGIEAAGKADGADALNAIGPTLVSMHNLSSLISTSNQAMGGVFGPDKADVTDVTQLPADKYKFDLSSLPPDAQTKIPKDIMDQVGAYQDRMKKGVDEDGKNPATDPIDIKKLPLDIQKDPKYQAVIKEINDQREENAKERAAAAKGEEGGNKNNTVPGTGGDTGGNNGGNGGGSETPNPATGPHSEITPGGAVAEKTIMGGIIPVSYNTLVSTTGPAGDESLIAKPRPFSGIPLIARPAPVPGSTMVAFSVKGTTTGSPWGPPPANMANGWVGVCPVSGVPPYTCLLEVIPAVSPYGVSNFMVGGVNAPIIPCQYGYYNPQGASTPFQLQPGAIAPGTAPVANTNPLYWANQFCQDNRYKDIKILGPQRMVNNTIQLPGGSLMPAYFQTPLTHTHNPAWDIFAKTIKLFIDWQGIGDTLLFKESDGTQGAMPNLADNPNGMPFKDTYATTLVDKYAWLYKNTDGSQFVLYRGQGNNAETIIESTINPYGTNVTNDAMESANNNDAWISTQYVAAKKQCSAVTTSYNGNPPGAGLKNCTPDPKTYPEFIRFIRDACTNQYLQPMSLNPGFLFYEDWRGDQYPWNEQYCQPLILSPLPCQPDLYNNSPGGTWNGKCLIDKGEAFDQYTNTGANAGKHVMYDYRAWGYLELAYLTVLESVYAPAPTGKPNGPLPVTNTKPVANLGTNANARIVGFDYGGTQFQTYGSETGQPAPKFRWKDPGTANNPNGTYTNSLTTINQLAQRNYERIWDVTHPYSPRWDMCGNGGKVCAYNTDRGYSALTTFTGLGGGGFPTPFTGYTWANPDAISGPGCNVRCAVVPVDILNFRYNEFNKCMNCRINTNTTCFWDEWTFQWIYILNVWIAPCIAADAVTYDIFNFTADCISAWLATAMLTAFQEVVSDDGSLGFSKAPTTPVDGVFIAKIPAVALILLPWNGQNTCKTDLDSCGYWPACSTSFDDPRDVSTKDGQKSILGGCGIGLSIIPVHPIFPQALLSLGFAKMFTYSCQNMAADPGILSNNSGGTGNGKIKFTLNFGVKDNCQKDANDYPDSNQHPSTVTKCCNDLAQAVAPINTLKFRNYAKKDLHLLVDMDKTLKDNNGTGNLPEGYAFYSYFPHVNGDFSVAENAVAPANSGSEMPYMRWWDTGTAAGGVIEQKLYTSLPAGVTPNSSIATEQVPGTWPTNYNPFCDLGTWDSVVGVGIESTSTGGLLGTEPKGSPSGLCRFGGGSGKAFINGSGGSAGVAVGSTCIQPANPDRLTSWYELKEYEAQSIRRFGMNCLPMYEKMYKWIGAEDGALYQAGRHFNTMIPVNNDTTKTLTEYKANRWPLRWRGFLTDSHGAASGFAFPQWDPGSKGKTGGQVSGGLDNAQTGDIIYMLPGDPGTSGDASGNNIMPFVAVVTAAQHNVGNTSTKCTTPTECYNEQNHCSDFVQVVDLNNGKYPDACGNTDAVGMGQTRTIYYQWLPPIIQDFLFKGPSSASDDCNDKHTIVNGVTLIYDAGGFCSDPRYSHCILIPHLSKLTTNYWKSVRIYRPKNDERGR